jgi:hypothetical protein
MVARLLRLKIILVEAMETASPGLRPHLEALSGQVDRQLARVTSSK